jgi:uncharacterized membrane protein
MLIGLGLQVLALSLISISVVQPIFVSGIVVLLVLSHHFLKEHLARREWVAISLVGLSLLAISLSLSAASDEAGSSGKVSSLVLAGIPTIVFSAWLFFSAEHLYGSRRPHARFGAPLLGIATGMTYGVAALATKAVASQVQQYGVVSAIPHVFGSAYFYAIVVSSVIGLVLFQTALQRCQASLIVPVSNTVTSVYVMVLGTVIFSEHLPTQGWKLGLRVIGLIGVLSSVLLLASSKSPAAQEEVPLLEEPIVLPSEAGEPVQGGAAG